MRAALGGAHYDYTDGPVGRSLWLLAIPMVLETLMESLFAVCDVFFVSRLGADAVATVGLTESMLTLLYALAMGLSIGATATVARRIGEKDPDGAARAAVQAIALGVGVSLAIGVVGALAAPALLRAMGATPSIVETGSTYTRVMLGGNATVVLIFLINAVFRGAGDAAIAMRVLWLANALNIVLGPCLVFGLGPFPALGVTGAAVATNLGRGTGVLYQLYVLSRRDGRLRIEARHLGLDPAGDARHLAAVVHRGLPDPRQHDQLGVPGADPVGVRQRGRRRQHHRHPAHRLRAAAGLGARQRRRDDGRPGARRRQARARRAGRVAGGPLQRRRAWRR